MINLLPRKLLRKLMLALWMGACLLASAVHADPEEVTFGGDLTFGGSFLLEIELAGTSSGPPTEYDRLLVAGTATLDGTLDVTLIDGFTLGIGQAFEIIDAGTLSGEFAGLVEGALVGDFGGTELFITYTGGDGNDVALFTTLPGDFDFDEDVDGADFLTWQRGFGNPFDADDLADWQANYGTQPNPLAAASTTVPEPSTLWLLVAVGIMTACGRHRVGGE